MLSDGRFWIGVGAGYLSMWAYHRYVKPMPTNKAG